MDAFLVKTNLVLEKKCISSEPHYHKFSAFCTEFYRNTLVFDNFQVRPELGNSAVTLKSIGLCVLKTLKDHFPLLDQI